MVSLFNSTLEIIHSSKRVLFCMAEYHTICEKRGRKGTLYVLYLYEHKISLAGIARN